MRLLFNASKCRMSRTLVLSLVLGAFAPVALAAQTVKEHIAAGDKATVERKGDEALKAYEEALKLDSVNAEAIEKAVTTAVALAEFGLSARSRGQLVYLAQQYARRLYMKDSSTATANFLLAQVFGRAALIGGQLAQLRNAPYIKAHAQRCLAIEPKHPGCLHILGNWHLEVMRLSNFQRQMAVSMSPANLYDDATWENATKNLEAAVQAAPQRIFHRVTLAQVYANMGEKDKARAEFKAVEAAPLKDFNDEKYKEVAQSELKKLD